MKSKNRVAIPTEKFNPIKIKYSHVCQTIEQRDLFVNFSAAMKTLYENQKNK